MGEHPSLGALHVILRPQFDSIAVMEGAVGTVFFEYVAGVDHKPGAPHLNARTLRLIPAHETELRFLSV